MTRPDSPATTDQRSSSSSSSSSTVPPYFEPSVLFLKLAIGCLIAGSLGFLLVIYTMAPDQVGRAVGPVVMFLLALVAWFLLARGRTKACVTTLVLGIWMVAAGVSVFNGGVRTPIVITYPLIIMMAGWLLGARMAITLAVLTVAINLTFAVAESLRILPMPPPTPPMMHWVVQAMVFVVSALVIVYLLRNHRNKIEVVSKLSSDLARLKAQAELADTMRRSEELLDQTGELANVGGWELELPSRVLRRTAQFYRILDLVPEAAFRVEEAFNSISAAARPAIMTAFQQAVGKGTPFDLELPLTTAKGRRIWLRAIGRPQVEDHRVVRITGVLQDITTRKQEEDALRQAQQLLDSIVEHIPVMLFVKRADDLRFELFNRAGEAMLGYTRAELLGKNDHDLFPAAQADAFTAADREVLASTDVTEIAQEPVRIASGETRYLQTRKVALRDATGKASHLLGISIDVTARKQSERALQAAKAEADRANVAKSEFLSRMSHELRTPLNAILGFGQLLKLELQTGDQADNVREILRAGQHLLDLINEVLDLARIESGKFAVSLAPVSLATLVADCLTLVRPLAAARGIRLVEDGLHAAGGVVADRTRLKQVLLNLLSNAVKYNRENGEVRIDCVTDDDTTELRITDTGAGLSPEQQARLFVPFERLDANQTAVEGTGIGLALSKRLMENMQGQIGVHSTQGAGSTFWVRLPVADREAEASRAAPLAAPLPTGVHRAPYHRDVLCIEDNPANLRLVERILARRADIRLLSASAPAAGLELAQAHCPDLILLDINLPGMDGYAVMRSLRDNPITRHIPVVAISANAMPADLARGQAAGFVEYLTKPLEVERLMAVVDQLTSPPESVWPGI